MLLGVVENLSKLIVGRGDPPKDLHVKNGPVGKVNKNPSDML